MHANCKSLVWAPYNQHEHDVDLTALNKIQLMHLCQDILLQNKVDFLHFPT